MKTQKIEVGNKELKYSWIEKWEDDDPVLKPGRYKEPFPNEKGNSDAYGIVESLMQSDECPFAFHEDPITWVKIHKAKETKK